MPHRDSDILDAPCWIEAPCLPQILNMLETIPHWYPIIKCLIWVVLVGQLLKSLPSLHLPLWPLRDMH